jgi:hypothetical protein
MYMKTPQAAAWTGSVPDPSIPPVRADRDARGSAERTIWARVPFQSRRGRCVALRLRGVVLLVGIAGAPSVQWLPARQVLTDAEAAAWEASGF